MPDATPDDEQFAASTVENATVTEMPPGEAPPGETPGGGSPDETPGQGPPSTVPSDGGLGATLTGNGRTVIHLGMNRPE